MKAITRHTHRRSVAAALMSGVILLMVAGVFHPAAAVGVDSNSDQDIVVQLGVHQFGDLRELDAIMATAGPDDVGFEQPPNGEGNLYGPQSFEVAQDGSIWLLDSIRPSWPCRLPFPAGEGRSALSHAYAHPGGLEGDPYQCIATPGDRRG